MSSLFPAGRVVATPGAIQLLEDLGILPQAIVLRHVMGDWGDLDEEDKAENTRSVQAEARILSAYTVAPEVQVWIITEWDRSVTTILLPSEY